MPYQVAYEFAKNRVCVIYETNDKYLTLEDLAEDFVNQVREKLRLKAADDNLKSLHDSIATWIATQKEENLLVTQISKDPILDQLLLLFDNKVGTAFSDEELKKFAVEGKTRYEKQIPPGYCDAKKAKGTDDNNTYGDLIVWKERLKYASEKYHNIST